jgi:CRISPR-associated endonuclease Csn1
METLGIDLGTNSVAIVKRNSDSSTKNLIEQIEYFGVTIFNKGVGHNKNGEFSYAAEKTKYKSTRKLYRVRKYRIWSTLQVLIENDYCPLSLEDLDKWRKYDTKNGFSRLYPINAFKFEQWVRLDFNCDGKPDYSSPYHLRAEIATKQLDLTKEVDRHKLGRALYHIAQRRGFKSSKGDSIKDIELNDSFDINDLKRSEELKIKEQHKAIEDLSINMKEYPTIGCLLYEIGKKGNRIRKEYQVVRSQLLDEVKFIFDFQKGLSQESKFFLDIKKSIFYQNPPRSQKGSVGKCTLEPQKSRCPISYPDFEYFRALSLINNIKFKKEVDDNWQYLSKEDKQELYERIFSRVRLRFKFEEIREWIEKKHNIILDYKSKTINYKDNTNISGCPITSRIKIFLGDDWKNKIIKSDKKRINKKTGEEKFIHYNWEDIWHVCFSFEDVECLIEFAKSSLKLEDNKKLKELVNIFSSISVGYSMLSLKAIRNINKFLFEGFNYSTSVLLAKMPEIFDSNWASNKDQIIKTLDDIIKSNVYKKRILNIVNALIAEYKSLEFSEQQAAHNTNYQLNEEDKTSIVEFCIKSYGQKSWLKIEDDVKDSLINEVSQKYQDFFASSKRDFYRLPKLVDEIKTFLFENYKFLDEKKIKSLYHPSMIEVYKPSKMELCDYKGVNLCLKLLNSPKTGSFKNPMAMRMLHILRKNINHLLLEGIINEETRIVVETARDLNDANQRWAINKYQEEKERQNSEIHKALCELLSINEVKDSDFEKAKSLIDQAEIIESINSDTILNKENIKKEKKKKIIEKADTFKINTTKYKLWLEQGMTCLYTGKIINLRDLFGENPKFDIEHTIPRSVSLDNSLENKTICCSYYNRSIKKNKIPTELPNYYTDSGDYTAILPRLKAWKDKVDRLENNVEYWKLQSKLAQTKEDKDFRIRQRHLWQMELNHWKGKLDRFELKEVTEGFKNSQLVDTRIITKYATLYLKSVFENVDVQKGIVTSEFRKILKLQELDKKKSRDKHSHHAIDAAVLTLIPASAKRDKILSLWYEMLENRSKNQYDSTIEKKLNKEIRSLNIGNINNFVEEIDDNILINHISKDRALTSTKKKIRTRGKVVYASENNPYYSTGDTIRGQLHGETYYGAIKLAKKDENNNILFDENNKMIIDDKVHFVIRKEISSFKKWEDIEKVIVDINLYHNIKIQNSDKSPEKDTITLTDKKGVKRIVRRIRCYEKSITNPIKLKNHTYLSSKDHKQSYYVNGGDLYSIAKYSNDSEVEYNVFGLFDISKNRELNSEDIPQTIISKKKKQKLELDYTLVSGMKVIVLNKDETFSDIKDILSKRLYVFERPERDLRINLKHHLCADPDIKSESIKDYSKLPSKIRCSINTIRILIEGVDFDMSLFGKIEQK